MGAGLILALFFSMLVALWCHWALGGLTLLLLVLETRREVRANLPNICWDESTRRWLDAEGAEVALSAIRIGPAIIGFRCERKTVWLWPDSAAPQILWQLRRSLCC